MKYLGKITDPKDLVTKEYADGKYSSTNPPPYPVTSVNGQTGAITVNGVPTASSSDDGKFLRVVDGSPAWATVPQAENNTF